MDEFSIMVCLSGSEEAEQAARLAWSLAQVVNCPVTAEHVVDASGPAWLLNKFNSDFVDREELGLSYSSFRSSLTGIAEALKKKYQSLFLSQKLRGTCNIDYGDPVYKLSKKADAHDLVLIGHRQYQESRIRGQVVGGLALNCPVPLIVVKKSSPLTRLAMLVSDSHLCPRYLRSCVKLASTLKLEPEIVCIGTAEEPPDLNSFKTLMRNVVPELNRVKVSSRLIEAEHGAIELWIRTDQPVDLIAEVSTLVVVPTMKRGQRRVTLLGEEVGSFLEHMALNMVCLWPEEHGHEATQTVRVIDTLELSA